MSGAGLSCCNMCQATCKRRLLVQRPPHSGAIVLTWLLMRRIRLRWKRADLNLGGRFQYSTALSQVPFYILSDQFFDPESGREVTEIQRYIMRQVYFVGLRPRNRFTRFELGAQFNNIDIARMRFTRQICGLQCVTPYHVEDPVNLPSFNYFAPFAAYVSDNTLFGYTGP